MSQQDDHAEAIELTAPAEQSDHGLFLDEIPTFIPAEATKKKLILGGGFGITVLIALLVISYGTIYEALGVLLGLLFVWAWALVVLYFFHHRRKRRLQRKKKAMQQQSEQELQEEDLDNIYKFLEQMKNTEEGREMLDEFVEEYMEDEIGYELPEFCKKAGRRVEDDFPIKSISFSISDEDD